MPGSCDSAAVRSAQASMTVRARVTLCVPNDPERSGLKQTTSHRPTELRVRPSPSAARSSSPRGGFAATGAAPVGRGSGGSRECRPERGGAVLEHRDVIVRRHLRRIRRRLRRQRVGVGAGHHDAVLPVRSDRDPITGEHVEAHAGGVGARVERACVDGAVGPERRARIVVVDEFAAVGEVRRPLDDPGAELGRAQLRRILRVHVNTVAGGRW